MELEKSEAVEIIKAHKIEISDEDPRSVTAIAVQFMLTGEVALRELQIDTTKQQS